MEHTRPRTPQTTRCLGSGDPEGYPGTPPRPEEQLRFLLSHVGHRHHPRVSSKSPASLRQPWDSQQCCHPPEWATAPRKATVEVRRATHAPGASGGNLGTEEAAPAPPTGCFLVHLFSLTGGHGPSWPLSDAGSYRTGYDTRVPAHSPQHARAQTPCPSHRCPRAPAATWIFSAGHGEKRVTCVHTEPLRPPPWEHREEEWKPLPALTGSHPDVTPRK